MKQQDTEEKKTESWLRDERKKAREEERKNLKNMGFSARLQYFWDYYKIVPFLLAIVIFVIYIAITAIRGAMTETVLSVFLMDTDYYAEADQLEKDFTAYIGPLKKNQIVSMDASLIIEDDPMSRLNMASQVKIMAGHSSGQLDVIVMDKKALDWAMQQGALMPLDDVLTEEEKTAYQDSLYRAAAAVQENEADSTGSMEDSSEADVSAVDSSETDEAADSETAGSEGAAEEAGDSDAGEHIYAVNLGDTSALSSQYHIYPLLTDVYVGFDVATKKTDTAKRFLEFLTADQQG